MYFSSGLYDQGNIQDAGGYFSYLGYVVLCLCQSCTPLWWRFLWSGCLRTSAFTEQSSHGCDFQLRLICFELCFTDKCLSALFPITWAFQLLWVPLVWKGKKEKLDFEFVGLGKGILADDTGSWSHSFQCFGASETDGDTPWAFFVTFMSQL